MTRTKRVQRMSWGMPFPDDPDRSEESCPCERLADLFHEAAETDCYVTRALVAALQYGIAMLTEEDFRNMILEIDDDLVVDRFHEARDSAKATFGPINEGRKNGV